MELLADWIKKVFSWANVNWYATKYKNIKIGLKTCYCLFLAGSGAGEGKGQGFPYQFLSSLLDCGLITQEPAPRMHLRQEQGPQYKHRDEEHPLSTLPGTEFYLKPPLLNDKVSPYNLAWEAGGRGWNIFAYILNNIFHITVNWYHCNSQHAPKHKWLRDSQL